MCITWFVTQFINSDVKTFPFFGNVLSEYNPAFEFYNYCVLCQMFWGVIEFSISLVECVKDCLYFPWSVIFLTLVGSLSVSTGLLIKPPLWPWQEVGTRFWHSKNVCVSNHSCNNITAMCETLYGFIFWRTSVGLGYYLILAFLWKTVGTGIPPRSIIFVIATACWALPWSVTKTVCIPVHS
jgi:hypothetical protein